MNQSFYLIIAIAIIVILLITFIVSFILYIRTPVPKGCEDIKISEEKCASCGHNECRFYPNKEEKE